MKQVCIALFMVLCAATAAQAARVLPAPGFSVDVPEGWQSTRDARAETPGAVHEVMECLDEKPEHLLMGGWKIEGQDVQAAFCVSYWYKGGGKILRLLRGSGKDEAFGKFADIFANKIMAGYRERKATVSDLSATLLSAGEMAVTTIDGRVKNSGKTYMRSDTIYLRGDAILNISTIYDVSAPDAVGRQADALPMSVEWK